MPPLFQQFILQCVSSAPCSVLRPDALSEWRGLQHPQQDEQGVGGLLNLRCLVGGTTELTGSLHFGTPPCSAGRGDGSWRGAMSCQVGNHSVGNSDMMKCYRIYWVQSLEVKPPAAPLFPSAGRAT